MALIKNETNTTTETKGKLDGKGRRMADGWLNVKITDKNGNEYNMGGFPLVDGKSDLETALIKLGAGEVPLNVTTSVAIIDHNPAPIELF